MTSASPAVTDQELHKEAETVPSPGEGLTIASLSEFPLSEFPQTPRRRIRLAFKLPASPATDSGYESLGTDCSPWSPRPNLFVDGPGPDWLDANPLLVPSPASGRYPDSALGSSSPRRQVSPLARERSTSVPARQHNPETPRSRHSSPVRRLAGSLRLPDRFIPVRDTAKLSSDRFRTSKPSHLLSPTERLLRNADASQDPFCPGRRSHLPDLLAQPVWNGGESRPPRLGTFAPAGLFRDRPAADERSPSSVNVWSAGGVAPPISSTAVDDGHGRLILTGTSAPVFAASFSPSRLDNREEAGRYQSRLASALDIDRVCRLLSFVSLLPRRPFAPISMISAVTAAAAADGRTIWDGSLWIRTRGPSEMVKRAESLALPTAPFRVLDAPNLRDDFYCSTLAYSATCDTLAVGLGNMLYRWSEPDGVELLDGVPAQSQWLTTMAFSSEEGGHAILAFGRSNGLLSLMSLQPSSPAPRFDVHQPFAVTRLCWRPTCTARPSRSPHNLGAPVWTEDLLVGDATGCLYYYIVEWPTASDVQHHRWPGAIALIATIEAHSQQVCGLAWSPDGTLFATGGNDNQCNLYHVNVVLTAERSAMPRHRPPLSPTPAASVGEEEQAGTTAAEAVLRNDEQAGSTAAEAVLRNDVQAGHTATEAMLRNDEHDAVEGGEHDAIEDDEYDDDELPLDDDAEALPDSIPDPEAIPRQRYTTYTRYVDPTAVLHLPFGTEQHRWIHGAAVKAIAFCPWQHGLVATGGGLNDRSIYFWHAGSGAALASIMVSAQVTSLVWSTTRREIAATFGYTQQPDHRVRIAVFAWPECCLVAAVSWESEHRVLHAIPYPAGNSGGGAEQSARSLAEGCLVVAASDQSIKFHEVWAADRRGPVGREGVLGGSDILEGLAGIDKEGDVIR